MIVVMVMMLINVRPQASIDQLEMVGLRMELLIACFIACRNNEMINLIAKYFL